MKRLMSADSATFKFKGQEMDFPEIPVMPVDGKLKTFYVIVDHWQDKAQPYKKFMVRAHAFENMEDRVSFWIGNEKVAVFPEYVAVFADEHVTLVPQEPQEVGEADGERVADET